jgi:NADPH2:quinone reductase
MRAWLLDRIEGLESLRLGDAPERKPAAGEVVMDVEYAALNPADRYLAEGQYPARPPLPHVLGRDGIGRVVEVGPNAALKVGEQRIVLRGETGVSRWGTFAQRVVVAERDLVEKPAGWSDEESAGATLVYLTAYQALTQWGQLKPSVVLVTGASGGVGIASIQLGAAMGHRVIALSRGTAKREPLLSLGAAAVLDPTDPMWKRQVRELLAGGRVDLAIDNIGGALLPDVIDTLGEHGKVSCVGRLAGPVPQFNTASLFFRRLRMGGVQVGAYTSEQSRAAWADVLRLLSRTGARPVVDSVFDFEALPAAFARLWQGPLGKVLLRVATSTHAVDTAAKGPS